MSKIINFSELTHFTPKQDDALQATKKYRFVLYGGTMGSGKSYFLRWACIYWLLLLSGKYKQKGIRVGLFCEDYGTLNDRHISKIKIEFPKSLGIYNEQKHEFTLHPWLGSGVIAFRNLDDPSKFVSSEFAVIAIDEISRDPYSVFSILRTRLRWAGIPETRFIAASNPVGEPWVKRFWIDRNFPIEEKEGDQFKFVAALPTDNPHLTEDYFRGLESLEENERKAYLEGDWSAFERDMDEDGWMKLLTDTELNNATVDVACHSGHGILGIDPAAGGDRTAIVYKTDTCKEVIFCQKLNDVMQVIPIVARTIEKTGNVQQIVIDRTGIGEGLFRRMKELGYPVKGVSFAESPSDKKRFANLKAELYWKEREWILTGGKLLKNNAWNDFRNIKWMEYGDRQIKIQGKDQIRKAGFKSPDAIDAAVLTSYASKNLGFESSYRQRNFIDKVDNFWK